MDDANDKTEVIQHQIDMTKASLVGKLEALETHVSDTVQATTDSVAETVNAVKETVESITDSVKETVDNVSESVHNAGQIFDVRLQAERRPWVVMGVAFTAGCALSYLLGSKKSSQPSHRWEEPVQASRYAATTSSTSHTTPEPAYSAPSQPKKPSWFWESVSNLSGVAIGAMMGVVREMAEQELPSAIAKNVADEVDRITTHLGGKPMAGPILSSEKTPAI